MAFTRYTLIGALATATHYAVLVALTEVAHWAPGLGAMTGALCGAAVAYVLNRRFTFESQRAHRHTLPRFALITLLGTALNGGLVWLGSGPLGWHYMLAQACATALVMLLTYRLHRAWTFS